tara:strand:- start:7 stop:480 length:474 start_codon:yes stop_codon:yes gene_type:complete
MLTEFESFLTFKNIYFLINLGVIPFWILLLITPNSKITQIFVNSIFLPFILSATYIYVIYQAILLDEPFLDIFNLYLGFENLYTLFATESFLLIFWIHFISINLFLGSWISKDALKYNISRSIVLIPLIVTYFSGPLGLVIYWFLRIFYAKKISLHE